MRVPGGVAVPAGGVGGGPAVLGLRPPAVHLVLVAQAAVLTRRGELTWRKARRKQQHADSRTDTHADRQSRTEARRTEEMMQKCRHDGQKQTRRTWQRAEKTESTNGKRET